MGEDKSILASELREKINVLIQRLESASTQVETLKQENTELKNLISEKETMLNDLETKCNNIKFANTLLASLEDKKDAKVKIKRIVREIDKCIALLNR